VNRQRLCRCEQQHCDEAIPLRTLAVSVTSSAPCSGAAALACHREEHQRATWRSRSVGTNYRAQRIPCAARQRRRAAELAAPSRRDPTWTTSHHPAIRADNGPRQSSPRNPAVDEPRRAPTKGSKAATDTALWLRTGDLEGSVSRAGTTFISACGHKRNFRSGVAATRPSVRSRPARRHRASSCGSLQARG
jgi:hypothetical protein